MSKQNKLTKEQEIKRDALLKRLSKMKWNIQKKSQKREVG